MSGSLKYRADIDGLRCFAILPVLLFHADIPGFSGGFVGVDVFFVISGFLITSIITAELDQGTFSIFRFYERRIRRILPALLVMLTFVLAVSPFFLLPSEFGDLWKESLGALLSVSNFVFWRDSGYFAADAEASPLLHTWSLGVEEQFYVVAPLCFWLIFIYVKQWQLVLIFSALIASLALCVWLTPSMPSASFYLVPTRAWELLTGCILALLPSRKLPSGNFPLNTLGASLGLFMLLLSVFLFDKSTVFPGYAAIIPVTGTALLICCADRTKIGRFLSWAPLVFIGLISYSLYLWHWPLTVYFRNLGWLTTGAGKVSLVLIAFLFGWLSYRFIEVPMRNRVAVPVKPLLRKVAVLSFGLMIVSLTYKQMDGWSSRFPERTVALDNARYDVSPSRIDCHVDAGLPDPADSCVLGKGQPRIALWGDSHGVELSKAISEVGIPVKTLTYSSCPPALGLNERPTRPQCERHNKQVLEYLQQENNIETVLLVAYYKKGEPETIGGMVDAARRLKASGKRVVVIGPTPRLVDDVDVPTHLARGGKRYFKYEGVNKKFLTNEFKGLATVFFPEQLYCENSVCDLLPENKPLLFDVHHPSMNTARITALHLLPILQG